MPARRVRGIKKNFLVTGGAGFIGSNLVERLISDDCSVVVLDNLSSGRLDNVKQMQGMTGFRFERGDLLDCEIAKQLKDCDLIFHLAANPDVRAGSANPDLHFNQNIVATYKLLEAARKADIETFAFTSTSTVYGEAKEIPTPETYAPLKPISVYGASKLACESLISSYAHTYGFRAVIYRLANIIGPRSNHGVIYDFILKLRKNPNNLEILGDGKQSKSYLHVSDCIDGMLLGLGKAEEQVEVFNIGSDDNINVISIADIVCSEMRLKGVSYRFRKVTDYGGGWPGDVKTMLLDISKLKSLGLRQRMNSEQAVRQAVREALKG